LQYADGDCQDDKPCVIAAVTNCGKALEFASDDLQADKDVVYAAVCENGYALCYAAQSMKQDRDVVFAAVDQAGKGAFEFADPGLQSQLLAEGYVPKKKKKGASAASSRGGSVSPSVSLESPAKGAHL